MNKVYVVLLSVLGWISLSMVGLLPTPIRGGLENPSSATYSTIPHPPAVPLPKKTKAKAGKPGSPSTVVNDPIRFTIRANRPQVAVGEEVVLSITAELMNLPPSLMFFLPGSNAYTLRLIQPTGFRQTGGDNLAELVSAELQPARPRITYQIRGHFTEANATNCFQLIRGAADATSQSLFINKGSLCLGVQPAGQAAARLAAQPQGSQRLSQSAWCVEAESGSGNRVVHSGSNASGGQFVGDFGNSSEYMTYTLTGASAGTYTLRLWYTSGETPSFGLVVNGNLQTTSAPGNGSINGPFVETTTSINLVGGTNTLRIQGTGGGNFRLDRFCLDGGSPCSSTPSLSLGTPACSGANLYSVSFNAQSGATVTSSAGTVQTNQIVNIPVGTNVTVTATLNSCSTQQTANSPASCSPSSTQFCVEAESGTGNRAVHSGANASGGQFVGDFGNSSEYMTYTLTNVSAGAYTLRLWYTSGETPSFGLVLNGNLQTVSAVGNGSLVGPFVDKPVAVNLVNGTNTLRIQGTGGGNFRLDRFCLEGGSSCQLAAPSVSSTGSQVCNGSTVTLTASGCSGSVTWSPGNVTGTTLTVNAAGTYSAICSQNSCNSAPSSGVTISGCPPCANCPTVVPHGYGNVFGSNGSYVPLGETGRNGDNGRNGAYNRVYIDNGTLKIGFNLTLGGGWDYSSLRGSKNFVNSPIWGNGKVDAGRQHLWSWYGYPNGNEEGHFFDDEAGQNTGQNRSGGSIGWNPVEAGDEGQNPYYGRLQVMHLEPQSAYIKNQGLQWHMTNVAGKQYNEKWVRFDPNNPQGWREHVRLTMFRNDRHVGHFPSTRQQEAPCHMHVVDFKQIHFATGQPYQNQWTSETLSYASAPARFFSNEPFIIASTPDGSQAFALYAPISGRFATNHDNVDNWPTSNDDNFPVTYTASVPMLSLDHDGVYDLDVAGFYGTLAECKAWCYQQPRWSGTFNYVFNQRSRLAWFFHHAQDQLEKNITDGVQVRPITTDGFHDGKDMKFFSPEVWIDGRQVGHVYIKAAFSGGSTNMTFRWHRLAAGQFNGSFNEYTKNFSVINDGQVRVYDIDLTQEPNWVNKDIIGFDLQYQYPYPDVSNSVWNIKQVSSSPIN